MSESEAVSSAAGVAGALLLGMALTPFRGLTPAANFTFAFMALTIVVAEVGGRRAATVTALSSALSLDFFLTQPYLKLTITGKDDLLAFFGLTACGLIAAAFGARRERTTARARHLDLLEQALLQIEESGPAGSTTRRLLDSARSILPVAALVVRDARGEIVLATDGAAGRPPAVTPLSADRLQPIATSQAPSGRASAAPLPADGGRVTLVAGNRASGSLELWGNGEPVSETERRVLASLARVIAARLALTEEPGIVRKGA